MMKLIAIFLLCALIAQAKDKKSKATASPSAVTDKARGDYWRAMFDKLSAQVALRDAEVAVQMAISKLCDAEHVPGTSQTGEPVCVPKSDDKGGSHPK